MYNFKLIKYLSCIDFNKKICSTWGCQRCRYEASFAYSEYALSNVVIDFLIERRFSREISLDLKILLHILEYSSFVSFRLQTCFSSLMEVLILLLSTKDHHNRLTFSNWGRTFEKFPSLTARKLNDGRKQKLLLVKLVLYSFLFYYSNSLN